MNRQGFIDKKNVADVQNPWNERNNTARGLNPEKYINIQTKDKQYFGSPKTSRGHNKKPFTSKLSGIKSPKQVRSFQ
jgi:hypothetical protein